MRSVGEQTLEKKPEINMEEGNPLASMPEELMRFIERDTYSLLIKGYAGAGKTTLALTILRALGTKDNFFLSRGLIHQEAEATDPLGWRSPRLQTWMGSSK